MKELFDKINKFESYNDRAMYEENEMFKIGLSEGKALQDDIIFNKSRLNITKNYLHKVLKYSSKLTM